MISHVHYTALLLCCLTAPLVVAQETSGPAWKAVAERAEGQSANAGVSSSTDAAMAASPSATSSDPSPLSPEMVTLKEKVQRCLDQYYRRPISANSLSPWSIMHALLPYGVDSQIYTSNRKVNALGWLCWNQPCRGYRLFYLRNGRPTGHLGAGVQGHEGQFLSILAQCRVRSDYVMKIAGQDFTIKDLVASEQLSCRAGTELTFKLIGLSHYLPSDATWKN